MIELIAGMGLGLWVSMAITVIAVLYARKHDLLGEHRDAVLRRDLDVAHDRIAELENQMTRLENSQTEAIMTNRKRLTEIHKMLEHIAQHDDSGIREV